MKVEVLFPELCNIFGDIWNAKYLEMCSKDIKVSYTRILEEPLFVKEDVDMVYVGSMPYKHQEVIVKKLSKYKDRLLQLIEKGKVVLFTGDAIEIVGKYIIDARSGKKVKGLGLFDVYFERNFFKRYNYFFLGDYQDIKMVGSVSTFSRMYGSDKNSFIKVIKGLGRGDNNSIEGINYKNFYATYLIGPMLLLNPDFMKMLLLKMGYKGDLYLKDDIYNAYKYRLNELLDDNVKIFPDDHG